MDTTAPAPVQAGVAVLVNVNLDTTSLPVSTPAGPSSAPASSSSSRPVRVRPSAWHTELTSRIDPAAEPWAALSESAAKLVAQRHRLQAATVALRDATR